MAKPLIINHRFGPFMVANAKFGKVVEPYFSIGFKTWPVAQAELDVEVEDQHKRMTATRILGGGLLLGPVGAILGGLLPKDVTKGRMILTVNGEHVQTYAFKGSEAAKAVEFVEAVRSVQAAQD